MTMAKLTKLYWDSCAWLGLVNGEPLKKRELEIVYGNGGQGQCELWTSALALVEVNRLGDEKGKPKPLADHNRVTIENLFRQQFVKVVPLDVEVADLARRLVRENPKLSKFKDAVHLASAIRWNIPILHTYDRDDLLHLSGQLSCKDGTNLMICYPGQTTDGPLFNSRRG
jgi:predicted nucleic acid-binding protein